MPLLLNFRSRLAVALTEAFDGDPFAAVAVVQCGDKWLLGLGRNTNDDRTGKWVFPGGHIKKGESPEDAAARECREETGIVCKPVGEAFALPGGTKKGVVFVHCRARPGQTFEN